MSKRIKTTLEIKLDPKWHMAYVPISDEIASNWDDIKSPRIRIQVGELSVVSALSKNNGKHHFMMGKYTRQKLKLSENQTFDCILSLEESLYGMDLPIELAEMMEIDPEGDKAFHAMTPGRQRSAIYFVAKAKTEATRVKRAVLIFDNIKMGFTDPGEFTKRQ